MKWCMIVGLLVLFAGCSTPEERIDKLNERLRSGKITMDEYNEKFRKLDQVRIKETRENFMR